ncbi:hypothetical protein M8J75_001001 [Diaphorina citri]|nr:hypothetical protein M8J75_001001 [Diaphorina citri]
MEISVPNLEQAIFQFYHSTQKEEAHDWLNRVQTSPQIWVLLWDLLHPEKASEAQYFAATTLHTKLSRDWKQIPTEDYETLKRKILDAVLCYATGPKVVFNRLCISLASFILRTIQNSWKTPIQDILSLFQNTSAIPPEKAAWVVLEILTVIPEEFQTLSLPQADKSSVHHELESSITLVTSLIDSLLQHSDPEVVRQSVNCARAWSQLGIPLPSCEPLFSHLIQIALGSWNNESGELCEATLETLSHILTHFNTYHYSSLLMSFVHKIMPVAAIADNLQQISTSGEFTEDNQELLAATYSLFVSVGETHTALILLALLSERKEERDTCFKLFSIALSCSNAPGEYPIHETYSAGSFSFWYILQAEVVGQPPEVRPKLTKDIVPIYKTLVEILLRKSSYSEGYISFIVRLSFCHELLFKKSLFSFQLHCSSILREELLELLLFKLKQILDEGNFKSHWQPLESLIHAFYAVAEDVTGETADKWVHSFFQTIKTLPLAELNTRIVITDVNEFTHVISGAYAEWIDVNSDVMADMLPLLVAGLSHADAAPSASMALKDITRDCAPSIRPFAPLILAACQGALATGTLKLGECARLMYIIGKVCTLLPESSVIETLGSFIQPYTSPAVKSQVNFHLRIMSALFQGLESTEKEYTSPSIVLELLESLLPSLENVVNVWYEDANIIEILCSVLKFAVITIGDRAVPCVPSLLNLVLVAHKLHLHKATLDISRQFFLLYSSNIQLRGYLSCVIVELIHLTLSIFSSPDPHTQISEHGDVLDTFFHMMHTLMKKNSPILVENENVNFDTMFMCAISSLNAQESGTVNAASTFLVTFVGMSRDRPNMLTAVQNRGQLLVYTLIRNIGDNAPRNCLESLSDVILALNKKYCDSLYRWMSVVLADDDYPSHRASSELKQQFIKFVLRERTNKRKLLEIVREFALICRGVITDTTSQPFLKCAS